MLVCNILKEVGYFLCIKSIEKLFSRKRDLRLGGLFYPNSTFSQLIYYLDSKTVLSLQFKMENGEASHLRCYYLETHCCSCWSAKMRHRQTPSCSASPSYFLYLSCSYPFEIHWKYCNVAYNLYHAAVQ